MSKTSIRERLEFLEAENDRLRKVNGALMVRVERSTDAAGSAYSLFESNLLLQNKINEHTEKLLRMNRSLQNEIREHRKTEEALERERDFTSTVVETSGALVVVLDPHGRIVRFNGTCSRITGYAPGEVLGKKIWDLFLLPEEIDPVKALLAELKSGHFPNEGENFWVTKDGRRRRIAWSNSAILGDGDTVEYIIGTGIDITERKEAEEKLRLYHRVFTASKDSIAIITTDGTIVDMNPALEINISRIEDTRWLVDGKLLLDSERNARIEEGILESGQYRGEFRYDLKDGSEAYVDTTITPILDEEGVVQYYVSIGRNITQSIHDQKALATRLRYEEGLAGCSQALLEPGNTATVVHNALYFLLNAANVGRVYIFENADCPEEDGLCCSQKYEVCAPGVSVELDNPVLQDIPYTGGMKLWHDILSRNEHFGDHTRNMPRDLAEVMDAQGILSILLLPVTVDGCWYGFIGFDEVVEEREWGQEEVRLLRTASEMIGGYLSRRKAFDELEEAHKNLKKTQTQLVHSEKMASLGMLVAGIAHEINTPMGSVNSMHDTLMRAVEKLKGVIAEACGEDSPNHQLVGSLIRTIDDANRVIRDGTGRVTTIVRRLRSFARLDQAELEEDADIHEGLEDTLTLIHHEIKHNITVHRRFGNIPRIACRIGQLNQVFVNLLINAKQSIEGKGEITITTREENGRVLIEFRDTGAGIPPEKLDRIFDPGFTTKGVGVGTGLGLSICYQIVQEHLGEIRVESEVGKGSLFTVYIPTDLKERLEKGAS